MAPEDRSHIPPLQSFDLSVVALTTHNLAWSPDAELAIGADDSVYIYLPEFPAQNTQGSLAEGNIPRQYHEVPHRFPAVELRVPELNKPLFDQVKQEYPDYEPTFGAGNSVVASIGASLNHVVALEWSPNGLGRMRRSVLAVLTGSGALTVYCEGFRETVDSVKIKGRNIRSINSWVVPWSVGGNLMLPRARGHQSPYSKELITSFAWARALEGSKALLAYMTDEDEIVIVSVQSKHKSTGDKDDSGQWKVEEVARFMGDGPHAKGDPTDPDYSPSGSSFALRWSPWLQKSGSRTAILSYVAKNYVGFRQVTIKGAWKALETPNIEVHPFDCGGICLHLASDAFTCWEDLIWTKGSAKECRGIIATPMEVRSFQVTLDDTVSAEVYAQHSTDSCETTYPSQEQIKQSSNPITGLIVHAPDISKSTITPYFSLTRLSATPTNSDWYQTNLSLPSNPEEGGIKPTWASELSGILEATQPFSQAHRYMKPDGALAADSDVEDSFEEDENSEDSEEDEDEYSDDGSGEDYGKAELVQELSDPSDGMERIYTTRARIWGMTCSPGGGVTAVFASLHSTLNPDRHTFGGLRCKLLLGRSLTSVDEAFLSTRKLSTEARTFEWMYSGGPCVPGVGALSGTSLQNHSDRKRVVESFRDVAAEQDCVFCGEAFQVRGASSRCARGHTFENCAATGLPILAPGISNTCAVCGSKCLKPSGLATIAGDVAPSITKQISSELCGGCGGKFNS
ncbi:transcription factor IIIC subunit delta N-term-domain-containing protein [Xylariales sp. AK1849]|nr:transcription factor IIIC subunit delta N-term-domain-containing protein [Xylariales sp. AK1849]